MVPEKDKVPLVVEGADPPALVVGGVVEQRPQHAAHRTAEAGREIVQNYFRPDNI